ncbi:MAG: hypothetical protein NC320_12385 [Clostridium sp.]|nr:hypothetical protein [Clostridium sp.]MCM1546846.1 hypothetical protein [Ruminococcus sp.]
MDFLMINSLNSYIKNMGLNQKWQMKKKTNNFANDDKLNELQRKNEQFKKSYMEQKENENKDETLNSIRNKVNSGVKLTPDEMKYLQVKDPDMYQKLKNLENEKKQYERELKQCKTKEEVEKLKFSKVSASLSAINAVKDNPNIPESFKLGVAMQEQKRLNELDKITAKFVKSGEYDKLPTEAEKTKAERDIREAQEAETREILKTEAKPETAGKAENEFKAEASEDTNAEEKIAAETNSTDIKLENDSDDTPKAAEADKEMTRTDAELTPEAQKVKRSKAKRAYTKSVSNTPKETPSIVLKG